MPTHIRTPFSVEELKTAELVKPFAFTKGCPVLKIRGKPWAVPQPCETFLFDVERDPQQRTPLQDRAIESAMIQYLLWLMRQNDAPLEQFSRLGLELFPADQANALPQ